MCTTNDLADFVDLNADKAAICALRQTVPFSYYQSGLTFERIYRNVQGW